LLVLLPPQEIAFLTLYLALAFRLTHNLEGRHDPRVIIVCPTGGVTVSILLSRLKNAIPEVVVVSVTSIKHLSRIDPGAIDAIISTAPVQALGLPVVVVSPLLTIQDMARIRELLGLAQLPTPGSTQ
jgi:mannitol operon transcriptional antiterminator